ncbi:16S/23S rRNA (cytidine-2'-O)-methyltransferase [Serinibacter arcticus]|uniref:16S/23S rRNA (Cytidine-2'-O)-methyltransferase n=1 Tax=Serinibacter arcticus TaxID=1655435 RepID=A0A2U1ZSM6_9MICO|nr:TlyA family RNA methyltransferase [Serinibacter arcticus]PWD49987.1 16S/23S rRNA (cytidine-2'-O)-methyltransferase [Serinibacter arcticus]
MVRADVELVARGLATSRTQAQRLIAQGSVTLDGVELARPSTPVPSTSVLVVDAGEGYVSRAAHKLAGALDSLAAGGLEGPVVAGARVLDAGASTGGFTDVVLRRGADHVVAVDVGSGQLDPRIRADPRVTVVEHTNVRSIDPAVVGEPASLLVADLSFISLGLVIPPLTACLTPDADAVLLVKPQFEVGRERLGSGGVVTDPRAHADAVAGVLDGAIEAGMLAAAVLPSPLEGTHGNREFVVWLRRDAARATAVPRNVSQTEHRRLASGAVSGGLHPAEWGTW